MLAFSNDYYGFIFRVTQSVELFCTYDTDDVEARICAIACSTSPEGASRWTMQAIADELIRLEVVDYITDSTVCNVMKKTKLNRGL